MLMIDLIYKIQGTERIQAIHLNAYDGQTYTNEHFKNLQSLRFLRLRGAALSVDFNKWFSKLRWLRWFGLSCSAINLHLPKLVVLELPDSKITEHWGGWSSIKAKRLKVLDLANCDYIRSTPNLSVFKELEILILRSCSRLEQVHPSIGEVKGLISLDLSSCESLKELPKEVEKLEELKELLLDHSSVTKIPVSIGSLSNLEKISAIHCSSLREIPSSIWNLQNLRHMNFCSSAIEKFGTLKEPHLSAFTKSKYCDKLEQVHPSIGILKGLISLDLRFCKSLKELPKEVGELEELKELILDHASIIKIPMSISSLRKLEKLSAKRCSSLREIPNSIGDLQSLQHLDLTGPAIERLPSSIGDLQSLQHLNLSGSTIERLPSSIGDLQSLQHLDLTDSAIKRLPSSIGDLQSLQHLDLSGSTIKRLPSSIVVMDRFIT
ncbi:hypothetical protein BT93_B1325 [Corymbia citriodora subsp. variegata]|nr:hypothetical protein BT93_B1325 [Corymbia citriodora subsp. variegata]KAF8038739.1 hypothetical protein BT93_B1325 [Corymbia citriodora subsp. variegata]